MSYPYGGGQPGYPGGAPGGYPAPGYPQQGGGPPGGYPGYNQPPQSMGMPTPESASAAAYGQPGGGLPYGSAPPGGAPGALGFNVGGGGGPGYPQGGPPMSQPGYPSQPGPGYPQAPGVSMPAPVGSTQPTYTQNPPYGASPAYNTPVPPQGSYGQPPQGQGYPGAQPPMGGGYPASTASGYPGQGPPNPGYQQAGAPGYPGQAPGGMSYSSGGGTTSHSSGSQGASTKYKPREDGTLKPFPNFNAEADAKVLRKAMKGFGTDEKAIIDVLAYRTNDQRQQIKTMFKTCFGKDLIQDLKSELGGRFEDAIIGLMMKPDEYDAYEMKRAMRGLGTDEDAMIEILCTRNNKQIQAMAATYKLMYRSVVEKDIISDTSGHFKRLMVSMSTGGRMENQAVDPRKAEEDAQRLYQAGEKRWGTDESAFNAIMASQSYDQLRAVFDAYSRISGHDIEQAIKREMSGNLELGMLAIVRCVRNRPGYFAEKLYKSMKGAGTDDKTLIRIIVTRAEVDMVQIKQEFQKTYGQSLEAFVRDDTSGDYRRLLLALVAGRSY